MFSFADCVHLKVLYFASKTYANILEIRLQKNNKNTVKPDFQSGPGHPLDPLDDDEDGLNPDMSMIETLCVNLAATHKLKQLPHYGEMTEIAKSQFTKRYILEELESADMICTTFGASTHQQLHVFEHEFTHSICDESNQSSLDTFLGIVGYPNLKYLCMAGDIKQLAPVTMSQNEYSRRSVYEHVIRYLTDGTFEPNEFYTRLNKQYRSHPQIYSITTNIFYGGSVDINRDMEYLRGYGPSLVTTYTLNLDMTPCC